MSEFVDHLVEQFETFAPVTARRMFGGHGLFRDGVMFGLVINDTLYFKADDRNRAMFEARGLSRFEYAKQGKRISVSYYLAPGDAMDDPETLAQWAGPAFEAGLRGKRASRKPRRSPANGDG